MVVAKVCHCESSMLSGQTVAFLCQTSRPTIGANNSSSSQLPMEKCVKTLSRVEPDSWEASLHVSSHLEVAGGTSGRKCIRHVRDLGSFILYRSV